jgi:20S proteasome subunit alpha 5
MFASKSEYDRGVNTFSPEGRIFQIEYALEAIKLGSTSLGIQTSDGVVIAAEKRIKSRLMEPSSVVKIMEIDSHIGCVMSGLVADARILVEHARVESQYHRFTYNEPIAVEACTLSTCDLSLQFGEGRNRKKALSRPFGVSLLIAGVDAQGPQLWQTDPSGTYIKYEAKAIGAGADAAQSVLLEEYHKSMSLDEATKLVVKILKQVMEDTITNKNVDVAIVRAGTKQLEMFTSEQIQAILASLPAEQKP